MPINFLLRSAREQRNIVYSFISYLKIAPVKLQIKVITKRADMNRHIETVHREMEQETNESCRMQQEDYLKLLKKLGSREAIARRFFLIMEYEPLPGEKKDREEADAISSLQTAARTAANYLRQCGNSVVQHENEDEAAAEMLYAFLCRRESTDIPFLQRISHITSNYIKAGCSIDEISVGDFFAPSQLDFTHGSYVYVDGIYLRRNWGGEYENVAILVAIAVNEDGFREILGAAEGMKEDKASWVSFFQWLRGRGLNGVKLIVGDKCLGMLEAVGEVFPDAKYQRCVVHFYRNVFSVVPKSKAKIVAKMLKAIHAQENKKASREKAKAVVAELRAMKLKEAAKKVEDGIEETLTYCDFPSEHWTRIRTNNVIERLNREIRRRTRVVGTFPDGNSALMLVYARLRHVAGTQWGNKKYMNMKHLEAALDDAFIAD